PCLLLTYHQHKQMSGRNRKIINDPVHGFITLDDPVISAIVAHPWYQRLRRIHQMAFAHLVYPGAVHSRLLHSLGAYHLMGCALSELKQKGVHISAEEERAAKIAILLPFLLLQIYVPLFASEEERAAIWQF